MWKKETDKCKDIMFFFPPWAPCNLLPSLAHEICIVHRLWPGQSPEHRYLGRMGRTKNNQVQTDK